MMNRKMIFLSLCLWLIVGYSASAQEATPEVTPDADTPELPPMIYGNESQLANNILLTIDDCADEQLTREMFDLLVEKGITATFFPNTSYMIEQDPQLWRDIVAADFEIGYHTRLHVDSMSEAELDDDFTLFQQEVRETLDEPDYTITLVRPPYGIWDDSWMAWTETHGFHTVRWNVVPRARLRVDYVAAVFNDMDEGGRIVLLHPRQTDMWWLEAHVDELLALTDENGQSFHFTTVSEAFNDDEDG
jgi:peptidoglycan/xylan/chitin deacetylase (PgdA/CDA1 family)